MRDQVNDVIRKILSESIDIPEDEIRMDADLAAEYGMDSTELTALEKEIESLFSISASRSRRSASWVTGSDIVDFVLAETAHWAPPDEV